jgi:hypothetical protein
VGACTSRGAGCGGQRLQVEACSKYVRVKRPHGRARKESRGMDCYVSEGCLLSLSMCRRGFQDLLRIRPSSLFILCGYISSSLVFLMSTYLVCAERSFESYSLIIWLWLMPCSTTADLLVCAS